LAGRPLVSSLPDHIRYALAIQLKLRPGWRAGTPLPWAVQQWAVCAPRAGAELAELRGRVAVFYQGAMVGELSGARLDEHVLLEAVNTGVVQEAA
jgi:hypothetical protein